MSDAKLGNVELQVLRALREQSSATVEQLAGLLQDTGVSSVVKANAALTRNNLVEPDPGAPGALRLTTEGSKLAATLPAASAASDGSGGGDSAFN